MENRTNFPTLICALGVAEGRPHGANQKDFATRQRNQNNHPRGSDIATERVLWVAHLSMHS